MKAKGTRAKRGSNGQTADAKELERLVREQEVDRRWGGQGKIAPTLRDRAAAAVRRAVAEGNTGRPPARHDERRVPSGHAFVDGLLVPTREGPATVHRPSDEERARATALAVEIDRLGAADVWPQSFRAAIDAATRLHFPPDHERWRLPLVVVLDAYAREREAQRLRTALGVRRAGNAPLVRLVRDASARDLLDLAHAATRGPFPSWLTPKVLASALDSLNVAGAGGRGKSGRSPAQLVAWLENTYARQRRRRGRAGSETPGG